MPGLNEGLTALEPDLIGEHHVLRVMTDGLLDLLLSFLGQLVSGPSAFRTRGRQSGD